jgi:rhodanese-related sulfurtransferase
MNRSSFTILLFVLAGITARAQQGQLYDNTTYKAIYFREACDLISRHPDLLLVDVRSPGEYADTSQVITLRLGHLKGAINVSIDSVTQHYNDLLPYKNKTILVYCSHSMRSRRVSKRLADSGFTNVYSLNGGMTEVDREPDAAFPCKASLYTTLVPYKLMGPEDAATFIGDKNNIVIDVRSAAEFNGNDSVEANNIGRIAGAINVPGATFDQSIPGLEKYKDRPILVYDLYTANAMMAASKLKAAGFKHVAVLFDGFDTFLLDFPSSGNVRQKLVTATPPYRLTGVQEAVDLVNKSSALVVADMRPSEEFENKSKQAFYNLGHIKNAISFPAASQLEDYLKDKPKNTPVLIYGTFSAANRQMTTVDVAPLCKKLAAKGYSNIYLLYDGIYSIVWASANVDGQQDAKSILTDHQGLY